MSTVSIVPFLMFLLVKTTAAVAEAAETSVTTIAAMIALFMAEPSSLWTGLTFVVPPHAVLTCGSRGPNATRRAERAFPQFLTMPSMFEAIAAVSFADTPLEEIEPRANQILTLDWTIRDRRDPWVVLVAKHFAESERQPEAELRDVMGDYWVDAHPDERVACLQ
jgi:hypothetical protein